MRKISYLFLHLSLACICVYLSSCTDEISAPSKEYFKIKVDSMMTADTVLITDSISIRLYAYIGPNTCYMFERFEDLRDSLKLDLTCWGSYLIFAGACGQALVFLDRSYVVRNLIEGEFLILVHQPDGSELRKKVIVR